MKRTLLLFFILCGFGEIHGQFNNNYWIFGDSSYIDWSNSSNPILGSAAFYYRNGSASIGDSNGLLLYAGLKNNIAPIDCNVWNKYHEKVGDSTRIKGGLWYHASLFVPFPGSDSLIYLFSSGVTNDPYGLYVTTINYKANNDSGVIVQKNFQLNNLPAYDALMGVKHGNGRDWWVIFQRYNTNFTTNYNDYYLC